MQIGRFFIIRDYFQMLEILNIFNYTYTIKILKIKI